MCFWKQETMWQGVEYDDAMEKLQIIEVGVPYG